MVRSANFRPEHIAEAVNTGDLGGRLLSGSTHRLPVRDIFRYSSFNNNGSMVPGSYAEVWLLGPVRGDVISVPVEALTEQQGAFYVYTRVHDDAYPQAPRADGRQRWPACGDSFRSQGRGHARHRRSFRSENGRKLGQYPRRTFP